MKNEIPKNKGYKRTTDINVAMAGGYIGEIQMRPTIMALSIAATFKKVYKVFTIYYYGTIDDELKKKFGYEQK